MKTVLLVPGFGEELKTRNYRLVLKAIEAKGYGVKFVPIKWARTTADKWLSELEEVYGRFNPKETILAGFSLGAMTAFLAAARHNPYQLWLFSLSPYFAETIPRMKNSWLKRLGKKRAETFKALRFSRLAKALGCKTLVFAGEDETEVLIKQARTASLLIPKSKLILVPNCGHDITGPNYIDAIKQNI